MSKPKLCYIVENGIKVELKPTSKTLTEYIADWEQKRLAAATGIPKELLFSKEATWKINDVEVPAGRCLDVALTDELNSKGSVEVEFNFSKGVNK